MRRFYERGCRILRFAAAPVTFFFKMSLSSSIDGICCLKARITPSVRFQLGNISTAGQTLYVALRQKDGNLVGTYLPVR